MTDHEFIARLARVEERLDGRLGSILERLDQAERDRREASGKLDGVTSRVVQLEARAVSPDEVHRNSIEAAVTRALRTSAAQLIGYAIGVGSLAAGVVFGVLTIVI